MIWDAMVFDLEVVSPAEADDAPLSDFMRWWRRAHAWSERRKKRRGK